MPELPEVETVVRGLRQSLPGRRILSIRLGKTDFIDDAAALEEQLPGGRIEEVRRWGKFLVFDVTSSDSESSRLLLIVHLGMTGQLVTQTPETPAPKHTHVYFALDDGRELRYTDARRFGRIAVVPESQRESVLGKLGLDPLETSREEFIGQFAHRRARVKALLMDQTVLRGMGNIYTDESLWRARIHPAQVAASLNVPALSRLHRAVRDVLNEAITLRGSSVSDYVDSDGLPGEFQLRHRVYQREGQKCFRCKTRIRRIIVAGRSSYFCPRCQPPPRRGKRRPHKKQR